jgi:hypothetical protein
MDQYSQPSVKSLAIYYNKLAAILNKPQIKRFSDRVTAERRCEALEGEVRKFKEQSRVKEQHLTNQYTNGELKLRPGTKRADIYRLLSENAPSPVPASALNPEGKGTDYAIKKLNEKLIASGSVLEIKRSKVEKVVYFALTERADR